jgi:hypothetical protein
MIKQTRLDPIVTIPIPKCTPPPEKGGLSCSTITFIWFLSSSVNGSTDNNNQPFTKSDAAQSTSVKQRQGSSFLDW